jgi:predicted AAA+ superfamily ATPase
MEELMPKEKRPIFQRLLSCPERSFFLFGPRGTGKTTWLQQALPDALRLDLLDASLYLELSREIAVYTGDRSYRFDPVEVM